VPSVDARHVIPPYSFADAARLERALGVSHVLAQVLVRRGMGAPEEARRFLAAEGSHPLDAFGGLREAAALILGHAGRGSLITVHGDYDADGVCSTAVLVRALRTLGARVDWYLPHRIDDGYGLAAATVERLAARGTNLLVTVDCAITAVEEVAAARAAGMDVVVTDHHSPRADGTLPDAPIVHPVVGGYPCPDLCATGVAYKLAQALLDGAGRDPRAADEDLDVVALATVADVVSLTGENRALVRAGLKVLASTRKPGLRALMEVSRVDPSGVDASAIGFRLAPRINAAGRLHRADAGLELLLTQDPERAQQIASELDAINAERRDVETRILFAAEAQISEQGERAAYVLAADDWHPGVVGIVASRVAERHHRPAVLIAMDGDEGTGSGRSIPAFDLLGGLHAASGALTRYGGHRAAAGCSIQRANLDAFREAFTAHAAEVLRPEDLVPELRVDAVAPGDQLGLDMAEELERLAPFGMGNPPPTLLVPCAMLDNPRALGEGRHVAFTLSAGGARSRAVCFGAGSKLPAEPGDPVEAAVRLEVNRWNGAVEPRLVLKHARRAGTAGIEVMGEQTFSAGFATELDRVLRDPHGSEPEGQALVAGRTPVAVSENTRPGDRRSEGVFGDGAGGRPSAEGRAVRDVRGTGVGGVLGDLVRSGPTVAVAAHAGARARALSGRVGGFALVGWGALEDDPGLIEGFTHVVVIDPPATDRVEHLPGTGWTHLAWGPAELSFALRIHEWDYALRAPLTDLYRAIRAAGSMDGEACEAALRGDGPQPRSAALAGRLVRVLSELRLVELRREGPALTVVAPPVRTSLERSPAFRAYQRRLEDGLRFLSSRQPTRRAA
jgi:single-stranded-DNA-specific exonuclease